MATQYSLIQSGAKVKTIAN